MRIEEEQFLTSLKDKNIKTIVDVGANIGDYTQMCLDILEPNKIYLIEPVSKCFNILKDRFKDSNCEFYNCLIPDKNKTILFYEVVDNESHSSAVNRSWLFNSLKINKYDMKSKTLDSIFKSKVIDLLKIDVEGLELDVLKGSVELLKSKSIKYIQFEYGGTFKDNNIKLNDVIDFLKKYDYNVYKLEDNNFIKIDDYIDDYKWINYFIF